MNQEIYQLHQPNTLDLKSHDIDLQAALSDHDTRKAIEKANKHYLHWEDLQYKSWLPEQFANNKEAFWALLRFKRDSDSIETPIKDQSGNYYRVSINQFSEFIHTIDKEMSGDFMDVATLNDKDKRQIISRNLIEESIVSSQLEGANTSRAAARKMLLESRKPSNYSEHMIVNNHKAMSMIEEGLYKKELTTELLFELHSIITRNTLPEEEQGKLRETYDKNGEKLKVIPWADVVAYVAPDKEFVMSELQQLINFANDVEGTTDVFIHPLIKGIMLHFWIGLLHPFEDGNGRLARIVFYWYMLRHKYWVFKYLSISEKIYASSKQYAKAYIYSEQDSFDLTYFIHYNIEKLKLARLSFLDYIQTQSDKHKPISISKREKYQFNDRQVSLLQSFYSKKDDRVNLASYQKQFLVKKLTAINDLKALIDSDFITKKKFGRNTYYYPTENINALFISKE